MPEDTLDGHTLGDGGGAPDVEGLGLLLNLLQCTGQPPSTEDYQKFLFILFYFFKIYLFGCVGSYLQHMGSIVAPHGTWTSLPWGM